MDNMGSLREIYPFDPETRVFTIPARLEYYREFFNPMDPSPAPTRDLSLELVSYLNQCSDEIPEKYRLAVSLEIQKEPADSLREKECQASLRSFYQHGIFVTEGQIRRKQGQALKYLLVSILCLAVYLASDRLVSPAFIWTLAREAILIGGWVFMWEAVTLNFIEMDAYKQEIRKCQRLINARVTFTYQPRPNKEQDS